VKVERDNVWKASGMVPKENLDYSDFHHNSDEIIVAGDLFLAHSLFREKPVIIQCQGYPQKIVQLGGYVTLSDSKAF
jgi:hypothetical protein